MFSHVKKNTSTPKRNRTAGLSSFSSTLILVRVGLWKERSFKARATPQHAVCQIKCDPSAIWVFRHLFIPQPWSCNKEQTLQSCNKEQSWGMQPVNTTYLWSSASKGDVRRLLPVTALLYCFLSLLRWAIHCVWFGFVIFFPWGLRFLVYSSPVF